MANFQVAFDASDPVQLGEFWAAALGYVMQPPPPGFDSWPEFLTAQGIGEEDHNAATALVDPEGQGPRIFIQRVPEPKTAKNRVHLDLGSGGGPQVPLDQQRERIKAAVTKLQTLGATHVADHEGLGVAWAVMHDPEGNEFCA